MIYDICIVGGGAAGLAAAISAAETNPELKIVVVERNVEPGRKILATGNGKCNLSNASCEELPRVIEFFDAAGILTRTDAAGRIYPYSEDSKDVRDALVVKALRLGVKFIREARVSLVSHSEDVFSVGFEAGKNARISQRIRSFKLLIAAGGKASPTHGSTGDSYTFAREFGHSVSKLVPVLTAVETKESTENLAGNRAKAKLSLLYKGNEIFAEEGEVQFTAYGISGICVFNLSRFMIVPEGVSFKDGLSDYEIVIDFLPQVEDALAFVQHRFRQFENKKVIDVLRGTVKEAVAVKIFELTKGNPELIAEQLKHFTLHPVNAKGWDFAQVTKGGVKLDEINAESMESKLVKGLYFAGEVLDYDGPCGGYNLHNAWLSGIKAGISMAK